jgi:hypothetical protein
MGTVLLDAAARGTSLELAFLDELPKGVCVTHGGYHVAPSVINVPRTPNRPPLRSTPTGPNLIVDCIIGIAHKQGMKEMIDWDVREQRSNQ